MMTAFDCGSGSLRQRPIALVVADRDDDRVLRVVRAHRDLAAQRLAIGPAEVAQRLRAGRANAGVLVLVRDDLLGALRLDPRQLELLAHDLGELLQRDLDVEQVIARAVAGFVTLARPIAVFALADRIADLAIALPDAALLLVAVLEVRDVDRRNRDRDRVLALLAEHLALRDVLAKVLFDLAADDLAEAAVIEIDLLRHQRPRFRSVIPPRPRSRRAR